MVYAVIIFLAAAVLLGYRVISSVPPLLHTPLMSGMNALSGITAIGALTVYLYAPSVTVKFMGGGALILAMVNVAGGFWVTERMLRMFRQKD